MPGKIPVSHTRSNPHLGPIPSSALQTPSPDNTRDDRQSGRIKCYLLGNPELSSHLLVLDPSCPWMLWAFRESLDGNSVSLTNKCQRAD